MAINIELRRKVAGSFDDANSVLHPVTTPQNIIGFLDAHDKINESFLPGSVFGGMRFVGSLDVGYTTGTIAHEAGTLAAQINTFLDSNGGTPNGLYWIAADTITITPSTDDAFNPVLGGSGEEGDIDPAMSQILEAGDWLVCKGISAGGSYIFAVVNNNYRLASSSASGIMSAAQFNKLAGIDAGANLYVHDTFDSRNVETTDVDVLATFTSNGEGHVTGITKRTLPDASTTVKGVTQLATGTELTTNLSASKPAATVHVKDMIDYFTGNTLYTTLANANTADHPNGAIVFVTVPTT